jgi:hypothetical protein
VKRSAGICRKVFQTRVAGYVSLTSGDDRGRPEAGIAGFDASATKPPFVAVAGAFSETVLRRFTIWLF